MWDFKSQFVGQFKTTNHTVILRGAKQNRGIFAPILLQYTTKMRRSLDFAQRASLGMTTLLAVSTER